MKKCQHKWKLLPLVVLRVSVLSDLPPPGQQYLPRPHLLQLPHLRHQLRLLRNLTVVMKDQKLPKTASAWAESSSSSPGASTSQSSPRPKFLAARSWTGSLDGLTNALLPTQDILDTESVGARTKSLLSLRRLPSLWTPMQPLVIRDPWYFGNLPLQQVEEASASNSSSSFSSEECEPQGSPSERVPLLRGCTTDSGRSSPSE